MRYTLRICKLKTNRIYITKLQVDILENICYHLGIAKYICNNLEAREAFQIPGCLVIYIDIFVKEEFSIHYILRIDEYYNVLK